MSGLRREKNHLLVFNYKQTVPGKAGPEPGEEMSLLSLEKERKIVIGEVQETSNSCTRLELKGKLIKELELKRKST